MSDYKVFVKDFPSRCKKLLNRIEKEHKFDDLEVTGLLMVASAAVNIPYERLRAPSEKRKTHPSGDYEKYSKAAEQFNQRLDQNFVGSELYPNYNPGNWRLAKPKSVSGIPPDWGCSFNEISKDKLIRSVLAIVRNALAHGNIFTNPTDIKNGYREIQDILLVSVEPEREKDGTAIYGTVKYYNCISVTPTAFKQFLDGWFTLIKGLEIYPYIVDEYEEVDINAAIG